MKWNNANKSKAGLSDQAAKDKLMSKAVLDDVLEQISGGVRSNCCHCHRAAE